MGLTSFKITQQKAVQLAECQNVPKVMVIAGPNGVGKSTLLYAIKQKRGHVECTGRVLYLPPHRIWRRQNVSMSLLWDMKHRQSLSDFLSQDSMPGVPWLRILDAARGPDSADEALSAVKYALSRFETRKMLAVNRMVETRDNVRKDQLPNIYDPVRKLTQYLLPHLRFQRIDLESSAGVRCLFRRTDLAMDQELDLDDLSSGERAIVSLFMPFLEREIDKLLVELEAKAEIEPSKQPGDLVVLMDEPELHLHPALQATLLDYLRDLTESANSQFILATHSPTLLSAATHEELYVLIPPTGNQSENQLRQLANSSERLQAMRDLCGDTYVLTACRNIICVEGETPSADTKIPTDVRILELLLPELKTHVLLPFGGKGNTIQAAQRLRDLLPNALPIVSVSALVDSDQTDAHPVDPLLIPLPAAMIENLLLVPEAIWDLLAPHKERIKLKSVGEIKLELDQIALSRREAEITLRVQKALKPIQVRASGHTTEIVKQKLENEIVRVRSSLPDDNGLESIVAEASRKVDEIIAGGGILRRFHGEEILREFHNRHVNGLGIGYVPFVLELARIIGQSPEYRKEFADQLVGKLALQVAMKAGLA